MPNFTHRYWAVFPGLLFFVSFFAFFFESTRFSPDCWWCFCRYAFVASLAGADVFLRVRGQGSAPQSSAVRGYRHDARLLLQAIIRECYTRINLCQTAWLSSPDERPCHMAIEIHWLGPHCKSKDSNPIPIPIPIARPMPRPRYVHYLSIGLSWTGLSLLHGQKQPFCHAIQAAHMHNVLWNSPLPERPGKQICNQSASLRAHWHIFNTLHSLLCVGVGCGGLKDVGTEGAHQKIVQDVVFWLWIVIQGLCIYINAVSWPIKGWHKF